MAKRPNNVGRLSRLAKSGAARYYTRASRTVSRRNSIRTFRLKPGVKLTQGRRRK